MQEDMFIAYLVYVVFATIFTGIAILCSDEREKGQIAIAIFVIGGLWLIFLPCFYHYDLHGWTEYLATLIIVISAGTLCAPLILAAFILICPPLVIAVYGTRWFIITPFVGLYRLIFRRKKPEPVDAAES